MGLIETVGSFERLKWFCDCHKPLFEQGTGNLSYAHAPQGCLHPESHILDPKFLTGTGVAETCGEIFQNIDIVM